MGKRSCVITLPSAWLQHQGLHAGDTISIDIQENVLIVSSQKTKAFRNFKADVHGLHIMLHRYVAALYKAGYDDIILLIEKKQMKTIEWLIKTTLVGFEIVHTTPTSVRIQRIAELDTIDVDTLIKQIFFSLQVMGEELALALQEKDRIKLLEIIAKDEPVNRLADSARRFLNKQKGDCIAYAFVEQLEKIGDAYKHLAHACAETPKKAPPQTVEKITTLLKKVYILYYDFNLKEFEAFGLLAKDIEMEFGEQKELFLLYSQVFDIHGLALTKNAASIKDL